MAQIMDRERITTHLGPFVMMRRAELGLSLDQVAKMSGSTKGHIWAIEKGRAQNPTIWTIIGLCEALRCSLDRLLGIDTSQPQMTDAEIALITAHRSIFSGMENTNSRMTRGSLAGRIAGRD